MRQMYSYMTQSGTYVFRQDTKIGHIYSKETWNRGIRILMEHETGDIGKNPDASHGAKFVLRPW